MSEQVVLTAHMVQPVFFSIAKPVWDKLNAEQKKALGDASLKTAKSGSEARLADEGAIAAALKQRGLAVDRVDLAPFCDATDKVYAGSDLAKSWGPCRNGTHATGLRRRG